MRLLLILISLTLMFIFGLHYFSFNFIIVFLGLSCFLVSVMVLDSVIIKLPESNVIRKWWRKNVVESTP